MNREKILKGLLALVCFLASSAVSLWAQNEKALIIDHQSYRVHFRPDLGIPQFVEWALSKNDIGAQKRKSSFRFKSDKATPRPRVCAADYVNTGYHKGHMCPAADRSATMQSMKSTFVMSNVCPMIPRFNTGAWKQTENYERFLASLGISLRISASPLFFPRDTTRIGRHRVAVPHAFLKVITIDGNPFFYKLFILENR